MSAAFKQAVESISNLSSAEKDLIAHCLISSLEVQHHDNVDQAWAELAQKRFTGLKSGKVEGISWNEIKKRIKQHNA